MRPGIRVWRVFREPPTSFRLALSLPALTRLPCPWADGFTPVGPRGGVVGSARSVRLSQRKMTLRARLKQTTRSPPFGLGPRSGQFPPLPLGSESGASLVPGVAGGIGCPRASRAIQGPPATRLRGAPLTKERAIPPASDTGRGAVGVWLWQASRVPRAVLDAIWLAEHDKPQERLKPPVRRGVLLA